MELFEVMQKRYKTIAIFVLIFLIVALGVTFVQPLKYGAQTKVLVVQEFESNIDPYAASKLNEYLSSLLAKIVTSESFFNQTTKAGFGVDSTYFTGSQKKKLKLWNKTIKAKPLYDSGIITLNIYHPNKEQAERIAQAAIYTLKTTNSFYHSIPNVDVRIIDSPSVSILPVKPNILLNSILGILFGLIVGVLFAYQTEEKGLFDKVKDRVF